LSFGTGLRRYDVRMALDLDSLPREAIAELCRRHGVRRLAVFGSALRDDFRPESDVDVLVEFEEGCRVGLRFFAMEDELSALLGRTVDLNTPGFLHKQFRDAVVEEAKDLHVAA